MKILHSPTQWLDKVADQAVTWEFRHAGQLSTADWSEAWKRPLRSREFHICYLFLQGASRGEVDGKEILLERGSFIWLQPRTVNHFEQEPNTPPMRQIYLTFRATERGRDIRMETPAIFLREAEELPFPLTNLTDEILLHRATPQSTPSSGYRLRALASLFFCAVFDLASPGSSEAHRVLSRNQCRRIFEATARASEERHSSADLARMCGLSQKYFTLLFHNTFGMPPRTWLMQQRIRMAARTLLESTMSVSEVALSLGYNDVFLFSRQFKQVMGTSPRAYRQTGG